MMSSDMEDCVKSVLLLTFVGACLTPCVLVCAVQVGGQPGGHGLLREGRRSGHPKPNGGPEC